ncbi:PPE family protein [Mycobacterium haemophilum DSM 44634]|uniref:PPE family protein n=1 Tax=Mycobacterium haemophilum TaxID=29311 RepID=UPI0006563E5D|nr:PPE family protein [Mycobacterium haemophilum]AKN17105.1 hypothetical protein B586_11905 [Mycobacterium haemophilum DSM 44634]MCV7340546.1 PPE family protein [Mycobacterium haemophilum DSM 44634]
MFYAAFPPEINSGRIYAGPGSGPMRAAAAAWDTLGSGLQSILAWYSSVISTLTSGPWIGPSSLAMTNALAPFLSWLYATAAQTTQAATQADAAASAYETALAAHVPPDVIAANRSQLASLMAANLFGQNTAAIAATEAHYLDMWVQDALAMDTYAGTSAAATTLTAFTAPPHVTDTSTTAGQAGALLSALSAMPNPLSSVLEVGANLSTGYTATVNALLSGLFGPTGASTLTALYSAVKVPLGFTTQFNDIGLLTNFPISQFLKFVPSTPLGPIPKEGLGGGLVPNARLGWLTSAISGNNVTANFGRGTLVGALTVPPSWATATPAIRTVAAALSAAGPQAVPAAALSAGSLLSSMSVAGMLGSALGAGAPSALTCTRTGGRHRLAPLADLKDATSPDNLKRLVAQISEKPETVQHHTVDHDGLDALLDQLSKKPGIHAVHLSNSKPKVVPSDAQSG